MTLYKLTRIDGTTHEGYQWSLPTEDGPGEWHEVDGQLQECANVLHCCTAEQLPLWLNLYGTDNLRVFEVEADGEVFDGGYKFVARRLRLVREVGRLDARKLREFACECAELVLPRFEGMFPEDGRPREAIETARRYARGGATEEEVRESAGASYSAYEDARAFAYSSSRAAFAAARVSYGSAAYAAAYAAAYSAAMLADTGAEVGAWQGQRLLQIASE